MVILLLTNGANDKLYLYVENHNRVQDTDITV